MTEQAETITREEFCRRFKAHMLKLAGEKGCNGEDVAGYADQMAPSYWEDQQQRADGPEECAESDLSYWEPGE